MLEKEYSKESLEIEIKKKLLQKKEISIKGIETRAKISQPQIESIFDEIENIKDEVDYSFSAKCRIEISTSEGEEESLYSLNGTFRIKELEVEIGKCFAIKN